jgi:chorismate mutase/prephenate dehydratase
MRSSANIEDVFASVEAGDSLFGVVPVENSTEGAVNNTQDCLLTTSTLIVGEIIIPIVHNLLGREGLTRDKVHTIASHKQSLAQCRGWLSRNFPHAVLRECASNAQAAELTLSEEGMAAIAGEFAAQTYGLDMLSCSIQDHSHNRTRFLIIAAGESGEERENEVEKSLGLLAAHNDERKQSPDRKTSILVATDNKPGALFRILEPFNTLQIDLSKIEARPSKLRAWEYVFFIDFIVSGTEQGDHDIEQKLFALLKPRTTSLRILGSYPPTLPTKAENGSAPGLAAPTDTSK